MVWNPKDVHYDQFLTNMSVGIENEEMIGDKVFPQVNVQKQSDKYYIHGTHLFRPRHDVRSPGAPSQEVTGPRISDDSYYCSEKAIHIKVTDEELANADATFTPEMEAVQITQEGVMLAREKRVADAVTTASSYNSDLTSTPSTLWNATGSNPIQDIIKANRALHKKIFKRFNTAIIQCEVMDDLRENPDLKTRIQYTQTAVLTEDMVASLLGIPTSNLLIPEVGYDTGNPTANNETNPIDVIGKSSLGYLWPKDVVLLYNPSRPGRKMPAFGYEFVWSGNGLINGVRRWREDKIKSYIVEYNRYYDLKTVTHDSAGKILGAYLFKSPVG